MYKELLLAFLVVFTTLIHASDIKLSNGKSVICTHEAYNCPSYKGKYMYKRLNSCDDVKLVWKTCGKNDPHGLDRDNDDLPCERDCTS
ncbi:hypothetical protein [Halobacteriovorax sp.]|uniref:hypothetical protein n=1 Tax=Halobacteriovorax sp. TaxID=2020862 RepID=UPI003AF28A03